MAKGQKRSNREPKKPKKTKTPGAPVQAIPSRDARAPRVFGRKPG